MKYLLGIILASTHVIIAQQVIPTGQELVEKMSEIMTQENSTVIMTQTITTSSGQQRTFEFEMFTANEGEKTLMRYFRHFFNQLLSGWYRLLGNNYITGG